MKDKSLLELMILKKKAVMDHDEKLLKDIEFEINKRIFIEANSNGVKEEQRKKAIERKRRYARYHHKRMDKGQEKY